MQLNQLIEKIKTRADQVSFQEVIQAIDACYHYQPASFSNGCDGDTLVSAAGSNEGSCKIFAFAQLNHLNEAETLACFGDYYRQDVLQHPQASDHANIRNFMRCGWPGIRFEQFPLSPRS